VWLDDRLQDLTLAMQDLTLAMDVTLAKDGTFATPTLLRRHPTPKVRIIATPWSDEGLPVALRNSSIGRISIVTALQRRDASAAAPAARGRGIPRPT